MPKSSRGIFEVVHQRTELSLILRAIRSRLSGSIRGSTRGVETTSGNAANASVACIAYSSSDFSMLTSFRRVFTKMPRLLEICNEKER